ncbi:MAG: divergent polysaccharide deacetylase family protein [Candidatus Aminicenantes bacterium]|nr:divergent polysaccharide deacetylase family protein [Candidatus Aminicenantes bacterium]
MQRSRSSKKKEGQPPPFIFLIFSLLVVLSVLGLDFIGWKKGERSYFFSLLLGEKKVTWSQEALEQVILQSLGSHGVSSDSIQQFRDPGGVLHLMIDLSSSTYRELESSLESELNRANASLLDKQERKGQDKKYFLWQVEAEDEKGLIILFSVHEERTPLKKEPKNKVAIIIDDMGYSLEAIREICSLKAPLTVSVLPYSPLAQETAWIAYQSGLEVMLHLPLESINNTENNDMEGLIHSRMSREEIERMVDSELEQVPYIKGVNNHMGSKITANRPLMNIILQRLMDRDLFFVDSRTSGRSVAYRVAQSLGIPSTFRNVFLDGSSQEEYIQKKLIELFRLAQKKGKAVGIGHPFKETLKVLKENLDRVNEFDLELVLVSQIVE